VAKSEGLDAEVLLIRFLDSELTRGHSSKFLVGRRERVSFWAGPQSSSSCIRVLFQLLLFSTLRLSTLPFLACTLAVVITPFAVTYMERH
jgi:hypothetical protein